MFFSRKPADLPTAETALKTFKQKNMGIMPRQNRDFATQLSETSDSLNQARLELKEAEQAREAWTRNL